MKTMTTTYLKIEIVDFICVRLLEHDKLLPHGGGGKSFLNYSLHLDLVLEYNTLAIKMFSEY